MNIYKFLGSRLEIMGYESDYHDGTIIIKCDKCGHSEIANKSKVGSYCPVCSLPRIYFVFKPTNFVVGFNWNKIASAFTIHILPMLRIIIILNKNNFYKYSK